MLIADADWEAIMGNGNAADYDAITGGYYADAQDPWTALDNGLITNGNAGNGDGGAAYQKYAAAPPNGSSYTPPSWLSTLMGLGSAAGNIVTNVAPIINGKAVVSPESAGQLRNPDGSPTVSYGGFPIMWIVAGLAALAGLFLLLRRR